MDRCVDDRNDIMQGHEEDHPVIQLQNWCIVLEINNTSPDELRTLQTSPVGLLDDITHARRK